MNRLEVTRAGSRKKYAGYLLCAIATTKRRLYTRRCRSRGVESSSAKYPWNRWNFGGTIRCTILLRSNVWQSSWSRDGDQVEVEVDRVFLDDIFRPTEFLTSTRRDAFPLLCNSVSRHSRIEVRVHRFSTADTRLIAVVREIRNKRAARELVVVWKFFDSSLRLHLSPIFAGGDNNVDVRPKVRARKVYFSPVECPIPNYPPFRETREVPTPRL